MNEPDPTFSTIMETYGTWLDVRPLPPPTTRTPTQWSIKQGRIKQGRFKQGRIK
jgi:hypothetical protein